MSQNKGAKYDHEESSAKELRRGPWTLEEDSLLIHYIARHGEGRWNLLARCSGLKRTGKSCRLRWLNYLKPDVKRGNLSLEEQFLILELHSKWGNRWSRIAQYLPGRTDNEIKNYWRTRVQKQARQLKIDANSTVFRDTVRYYWVPRLVERMASNGSSSTQSTINQNYSIQPASSGALGQQLPQHLNNFPPQDYYLDPSSTNSYITTSTNAPFDMFVHGMQNDHNNFEELDFASSTDCNIEEGSNSNLGDELWSLDEFVAC